MTEREWLASEDPAAMLAWVERGCPAPTQGWPKQPPNFTVSDRKLRLFACSCVRAVSAPILPNAPDCIGVAERFADGHLPSDEEADRFGSWTHTPGGLGHALRFIVGHPAADRATQAALLRDIVGNPFRPVMRAAQGLAPGRWASYLLLPETCITPTVLSLASAAYEDRPGRECRECWEGLLLSKRRPKKPGEEQKCRHCDGAGRIDDGSLDPVRLMVLADALEEAGCPTEDGELTEGPEIAAGKECPYCLHWPPNSPDGKNGWVKCERWRGRPAYGREYEEGELGRCEKCNRVWDPDHDTVRVVKRWPHPLLAHLRSPGPHVRGCWALDVLLGKS